MLKKATVSILLCICMVICSGCDSLDSFSNFISELTSSDSTENLIIAGEVTDYTEIAAYEPYSGEYYRYFENNFGYESLENENLKKCYDKISQNIFSISEKANADGRFCVKQICMLNCDLSERDIRQTIFAYEIDNPQIFWLDNTFAYGINDGNTIIQLYSYIPASECSKLLTKLQSSIKKIVDSIPSGMTIYERELYLHDYIVNKIKYADKIKSISDGWEYFTSIGALLNNSAVCEGYAKAMQLLLSSTDIECILVNGKSKNELHMWNLVSINGEWYHLDPTWDDADSGISYRYFNLSDDEIKLDHIISDLYSELSDDQICGTNGKSKELFNFKLPQSTSTKYNFFNQSALLFEGLDTQTDENFISALVDAAQNKKEKIYVKVAEKQSFDEVINVLFYNSPNKYFYYVAEANSRLFELGYNYRIESENATVSKDSDMKTIEIIIELVK